MDKEEYKLLITDDHSTKHKFYGYYDDDDNYHEGFMDIILDPIIDSGCVVESMGESFDVNNAAGNQLDIIGEMVGVSRLLPVSPSVGNRDMSDEEFLMCIRMGIAKNNWDGTNDDAVKRYNDVLGSDFSIYYVDNQDMSVDIVISGITTAREAEILFLSDVLLVPAGVRKNAVIINSNINTGLKISTGFLGEIIYESIDLIQ